MEGAKELTNKASEGAKHSGFDWLAHNIVNPAYNATFVRTVNGGIELAALATNNKEICKHKLQPGAIDIAKPGTVESLVQSGTELLSSLFFNAIAGQFAGALMRPAGVGLERATLRTIESCLNKGKPARLPAEIGSLANRLLTNGRIPAQVIAGAAIDGIGETQTGSGDLTTLAASHLGNFVGGAVSWGLYEHGNFKAAQFQLAKRCGVTSNYGLVPAIVNELGRVGIRASTGAFANLANNAISEKIGRNKVSLDECIEAAGYGAVFNTVLPYAQRAVRHVPVLGQTADLEQRSAIKSAQRLSVFNALQSEREIRPDKKHNPLIGAVLLTPDGTIHSASRGEITNGCHGEFTLLERKLPDKNLRGSKLFVNLEPCAPAARSNVDLACAKLIVNRGISDVWVGIKDPDLTVCGQGLQHLKENGVRVHRFAYDLRRVLKLADKDFLDQAKVRANDPSVRVRIAENPALRTDMLRKLAHEGDPDIATAVANNKTTPAELLKELVAGEPKYQKLRLAVAEHKNTPSELLERLSQDGDARVREGVAKNGNTPAEVLQRLSCDENSFVRQRIAENKNTPIEVIKQLASDKGGDMRVRQAAGVTLKRLYSGPISKCQEHDESDCC